ncbi:MAG: hypothetical protein E5W49_16170 [Mesorhizobium sp.]|nr:MAG: hypothetical protein EOS35_21360 [Mesorhizobium sp.]RWE64899.1 MAG: hypothetical protein EOS62_27410 [Mesorhizobium sp.]RWE95624.1 MAG: hypothetical protein EOS43_24525 [Mesorhizobium sp.]TIU19026.1 MAG: hypothetical protein E5W49_16170 [Mesorhizobium sp.]TIX03633.1 MAG: hypothetical protein E5V57_18130 [Mesorhizobium sp.]
MDNSSCDFAAWRSVIHCFHRSESEPDDGQATREAPDQLNDIAHPEAHRPAFDIKAGLITNLMSMR